MSFRWVGPPLVLAVSLGVVFANACTIWNGVTLEADASPGAISDAAPVTGYSATVQAAGPIAYWRFDSIETGAGGARIVRDVSGHGHDCTASTGVSIQDGPVPGMFAAHFGERDGIDCSGDSQFGFAALSPFTFEAFVFLDADGPRNEEQYRFVFDRMAGGTPASRLGYYGFLYRGANSDDWSLALERWSGESRESGVSVSSRAELAPSTWAHFAFTQDASGKLTLYLNGSRRKEATAGSAPASSDVKLILGRNQNGSCCALVGQIAEMAIFDQALDAATVERHYHAAYPAAR